ncbi:hypothetical protein VU10_05010 [Desulfobulbus sp. US1]|nr:hypothetical protein [Desulfobulbus sp. US4]MCW5207502.1 hypothetical protein [Desulfobulbus sp. US2]MCW5209535.1 hypothetical protein [Desulfobulbus sp. US1]MCW5214190.1 hypothetical protein [Desulfobulbus sp. US5]
MAVIGRIILCSFLTCIVQCIAFGVSFGPHSSGFIIAQGVSVALSLVLLFFVWKEFAKMYVYLARARMAQRPDRFNPGKIDCYVRFNGKIAAENRAVLPHSDKECAFYSVSIVAEWETKRKKPAKGMEIQLKPLFSEQSADEFELVGKFDRVYIKAADFTKSWLQLRKNDKNSSRCPEKARGQDQAKYKKYHVSENFARSGDMLTAQGKLVREADGRLFIKPTGRLKFPSFVVLKERQGAPVQLVASIIKRAKTDAVLKQIHIAALIINALLLFYFFIVKAG